MTGPTEMELRVARAISAAYWNDADRPSDPPEKYDWAIDLARAAIKAMREPTEVMTDAAYRAYFPEMNCQVGIRKACIAYIDAASAPR